MIFERFLTVGRFVTV